MPEDLTEVDPDFCSRPGRVGVPWHSWRFDADDRHIICQFCGEVRDSLSGRVIRPAEGNERQPDRGEAVMPSDLPPNDPIGAPDLPCLCPQCGPVVELARHLEHVGAGDLERAAESKANSCPDCYRLNGRTMR